MRIERYQAADSQAGAPRVSVAFQPKKKAGAADAAAGLRPNPSGEFHGSYHASNAGSRCPLWSPDALLEPEDGPLHLRSSQQDSHHQPRKDAADVQRRAEVRASTGSEPRHDPVRRHEASIARHDRRRGTTRWYAVRERTLARRYADQLQDAEGFDQAPEGHGSGC